MTPSRFAGALGALALGLLAACDGGSGPPPQPSRLEVVGNAQSARVGAAVPTAPSVRVVTSDGEPVADIAVTFSVTHGGGAVSGATQTTDANGVARVGSWTLGTAAGHNQLRAEADELSTVISATGLHGPPVSLALATPPPTLLLSAFVFAPQPVVELRDTYGNPALADGRPITVSLASGTGALSGTTTIAAALGRAAFSDLSVTGSGSHQLRFTAADIPELLSPSFEVTGTVNGSCGGEHGVELDLELGETVRRTMAAASAITCLEFDVREAADQQYLVLLENVARTGSYDSGLFTGAAFASDLTVTLALLPATFDPSVLATPVALQMDHVEGADAPAAWDFGAGTIHEAEVALPAGRRAEARVLRNGELIAMNSVVAEPQVGDTVVVYLEGISRLGLGPGDQRAVIRHISNDLVFAEDVRLATTLRREGGELNTPLTVTDMDAIAAEYAAYAKVQADALFEHRHNSETEAGERMGGRVLAVHTLMPTNNTWGYTYTRGDYFAFDYWVATNGSTKGFNQLPQRLADNLFMHEIAHMRHWGLLERAGRATAAARGNRWLVEGFARFTERLPIAMRLLGTPAPSRTANLQLPLNPVFNGSYFFDDVPTYLAAGASLFGGYAASSYVFDYFADLAAANHADPLAALRDFVVNGGSEVDLSLAVGRWLPGTTFPALLTAARIALYTDDWEVSGLPAATQYQQFQLRASRPPGTQSGTDPRNAWPKLRPGALGSHGVTLQGGTAYGFLIDGTAATGSARIDINTAPVDHGVVSVTRIR